MTKLFIEPGLTACFPRLFINKKANSKDNEFKFLFGIVGFWFCRNTTDAVGRWGCGGGGRRMFGEKVPIGAFRVAILVTEGVTE